MRDTFDFMNDGRRQRERFAENESIRGNEVDIHVGNQIARSVRANLCDLDLILHNDNPQKAAIAVSLRADTPFAQWVWLPRSMIEYERNGAHVWVTMPESLARDKGLI